MVLESFAGKAIDVALAEVTKAIERAKQTHEEDLQRAFSYIEAARVAIWGLEQEREQILSDASVCDTRSEEETSRLLRRIDLYLHTNRLRPELDKASVGLRGCLLVLQRKSDRLLQWPWKRPDRQQALEDFAQLLERLVSYLEGLGSRLSYMGASGVGVLGLEDLERVLSRAADTHAAAEDIQAIVHRERADVTNGGWIGITDEMERLIATLRREFL